MMGFGLVQRSATSNSSLKKLYFVSLGTDLVILSVTN
jgi:hypothetical protein